MPAFMYQIRDAGKFTIQSVVSKIFFRACAALQKREDTVISFLAVAFSHDRIFGELPVRNFRCCYACRPIAVLLIA